MGIRQDKRTRVAATAHRARVRATPLHLAAGLMLLSLAAPALASGGDGGALDRFEKAHKPSRSEKPKEERSGSSPTSSLSSSSSDDASVDNNSSDSSSSSSATLSGTALVLLICLVPPITFACLVPSHRVAVRPYGAGGLYIVPTVDMGAEEELVYRPDDLRRARSFELGLTGFRALNEDVFSTELALTFWLQAILLRPSWERLHERIETTGGFDKLDLMRVHLGANVLGSFVHRAELYMMAGGLFLDGSDEWLGAFDVGGELRVYPSRPIALHLSTIGSVFRYGPALFDTRLEGGIAIGHAEVRVGTRWLTQSGEQGFWGPTATVAGRF